MARIKLQLPDSFLFSTELTVRIGDLNYGNHLSNDVYLSYMHESRQQFLKSMGYSELDLAGVSVIMGDTAIVFKQECFYGDQLLVELALGDIGVRSFDLLYRFTKKMDGSLVCEAKTGMVCFNYQTRKTVDVPAAFVERIKHLQ